MVFRSIKTPELCEELEKLQTHWVEKHAEEFLKACKMMTEKGFRITLLNEGSLYIEKEGIPLPPGRPLGSKIMKFTKMVPEGKSASAGFHIPVVQPGASGATGAWAAGPPPKRNKIGRNDPCPCGSGKKYKRCHGAI